MSTTSKRPRPPFPPQDTGEPPGLEEYMSPRPQYQAPEYKPAGKLAGLVALVTGADSGIGRSVALLYAKEGARIAFTYLPEEIADATETATAIEEAGSEA